MNIEELDKYAFARGLNLGQAEKDYYQNIVLFTLYNKVSKELVFKGGTALAKCYGLNRFSEDVDFTVTSEADFMGIASNGLNNFNVDYTIKKMLESPKSRKYKLKIKGPLYKGQEKTLCSITLDFSLREKVILEPNITTIAHHMDVVPAFDVYAMKEEEILAEKIRAIMTRSSARDLYDIVFLLRKGTRFEKNVVNEKLKLVNIEFGKKELMKKCGELNLIWQSELKSLVKNVPNFNEYVKEVEKLVVA
ncbi:nucleotidyl transferase AbiEii/AbiGii toxin family protein [Candidatus Micrarchaeota archaeon]|nr:nucleotidyl transferase AbiEii/AbiGii toxin family protein [Candidatus Micrarchaeota archaeon]